MKKFFLIPLMTLMCSVAAWGVDVTSLEELQAALSNGGAVVLAADINAGATELVSAKTTTLDLNGHTLSGAKNNGETGVIKVTGGALTVTTTKEGGTISAATQLNAICVKGGTLTINAGTFNGTYEAIYGTGGTININGGTFTTTNDNAVWAKGAALNITAGNFDGAWYDVQADAGSVTRISGGIFAGDNDGTLAVGCYSPGPDLVITGGTFNGTGGFGIYNGAPIIRGGSFVADPSVYVDYTGYVVNHPSNYTVTAASASTVAYIFKGYTAYNSLSDAVAAASDAQEIFQFKDDASAVVVSKNVTVHSNGHSSNLSAGEGYGRVDRDGDIVFTDNLLAAFLMSDGTKSFTVDATADISSVGVIHVKGNKTLTINEGVIVTYKRQGSLGNIVVDEGAKLTVLGSGTFQPVGGTAIETDANSSNQVGNRVIDVNGELVVGVKDDADNQPHFITTSLARGGVFTANAGAEITINNVDIQAACACFFNYGTITINGGEFKSTSTVQNGINTGWYSYALRNDAGSYLIINGGHFVGTQGCVAVYAGATADINGGTFETVYGRNYSTDKANTSDNHYALYVATLAVVNVYGGSFKVQTPSAGGNTVVLVGNDDAYNTYGIINLYGGKFPQKVKVSPRKNSESSYPASVPATSQWYSCFGSEAPLPAGYQYYETGEEIYTWGVRRIPGTDADEVVVPEVAPGDPEPTIPWQQETTWASEEVPEKNTIVTIPVGATVVVSNEEEETTATAEQVFVNQGATLKVESGTVLNVGDGGVNVANGGQIVVEPGAIITVGSAGLVTTEDEALVVESSDTNQGAFLIAPTVTENTQPKATVKLTSKAQQLGAEEFVFERFAIPTKDGSQTKYNAEHLDTVTIYNDGVFAQGLYKWDGSTWADVASFKDLEPFKGYQLTNTSKYGNVVYTFEGNLVGNTDQDFSFAGSGFGFFGNSYSADINILKFLKSFGGGMQRTIWIYDPYTDQFKTVSESSYGSVYYGTRANRKGKIEDIRSMQAFLMNTFTEGESSTGVDYASAIWGNPKYNLVPAAPAPARYEAVNEDRVTIYVATQTHEDEVTFIQSEDYSNDFDNGADASKWMNEGMNLYIVTALGDMSDVATNDITDMTITFKSGNESNYVLGFDNLKGQEFAIRDILTGAVINMKEGATYEFTQEPNTTVNARFQIVGSHKVPTGLENSEGAPVMQKIIKNGTLYILRDSEWYTVDGQEVK